MSPMLGDSGAAQEIRAMPIRVDKWVYQNTVASDRGPESSTSRYVALGISLYMNAAGENAFPSQEHIAERLGLSVRSVRDHIGILEAGGWLEVSTRGRNGQGWRLYQYFPAIPDDVSALKKRAEGDSPRFAKGAASDAKRAASDDRTCGTSRQNVGKEIPPNRPSNRSLINQGNGASRVPPKKEKAKGQQPEFEVMTQACIAAGVSGSNWNSIRDVLENTFDLDPTEKQLNAIQRQLNDRAGK